jgi:PQQ-dependent dehydrogenase (methanol/ethanol family)
VNRALDAMIHFNCAPCSAAGVVVAVSLTGVIACNSQAAARSSSRMNVQQATANMAAAMQDSTTWPSFGRDYTNDRYSPLTQINTGTVAGLQLAWTYSTGITKGFEVSPVVVGRVMYITTSLGHTIALDAQTGRKLWEHVESTGRTNICCGSINRGAAVYGGRVYVATLDARLVALDARTGATVWNVNVGDNTQGYSLTAAPLAVDGKIIIGISGGEYGIRGYVSAYDADTGKRLWRWYTIPSPQEGGWWGKWATTDPFGTPFNRDIAREKRDSAAHPDAWKTGGAPMWQTPAYDTATHILVFTTGNPAPDVDGSQRPGDNLYANSMVGLDIRTGTLKWHMQEVSHDVWDFDAASPVLLFDARDESGNVVPAAGEAGKTGWLYIVDRRDGRPIRKSEEFTPHTNMFTQPLPQGIKQKAGAFGGSEWSPAAYSPQTGYAYVLGLDMAIEYKVRHEDRDPGAWWVGGAYYGATPNPAGTFTAIDVNTGKIAWQVNFNKPMIGGALATAGGLVFTGTSDKRVVAFDARSGNLLWQYDASAGVNAPPVTYSIDGEQYVAVAAGGNWIVNSPRGDQLLVFKLGAAPRPATTAAPQ